VIDCGGQVRERGLGLGTESLDGAISGRFWVLGVALSPSVG
jgi:hypothetical protein